nr:uncharacterized protein LOC109028429 isoform X3 [Gorilla gorilla gorilla]
MSDGSQTGKGGRKQSDSERGENYKRNCLYAWIWTFRAGQDLTDPPAQFSRLSNTGIICNSLENHQQVNEGEKKRTKSTGNQRLPGSKDRQSPPGTFCSLDLRSKMAAQVPAITLKLHLTERGKEEEGALAHLFGDFLKAFCFKLRVTTLTLLVLRPLDMRPLAQLTPGLHQTFLKCLLGSGAMARTCNPSTLGGQGRRTAGVQDQPVQQVQTGFHHVAQADLRLLTWIFPPQPLNVLGLQLKVWNGNSYCDLKGCNPENLVLPGVFQQGSA